MSFKKLFLVRHADYNGGGADPHLSEDGKSQSILLSQKIKSFLEAGESITIWTSSANRAHQTAQIIKQEMQLADMLVFEKLWSDNRHTHDFNWLKTQINEFEGDVLIIVSHMEYVREFPHVAMNFPYNNAGYAEGVYIAYPGTCVNI